MWGDWSPQKEEDELIVAAQPAGVPSFKNAGINAPNSLSLFPYFIIIPPKFNPPPTPWTSKPVRSANDF